MKKLHKTLSQKKREGDDEEKGEGKEEVGKERELEFKVTLELPGPRETLLKTKLPSFSWLQASVIISLEILRQMELKL